LSLGVYHRETTYTKVLDVREDLVVEGKVVAGDDVDTGILLDLPVSEAEPLGLGEKLGLGDLSTPVCKEAVSILSQSRWKQSSNSQASVAFLRSRFTPIRGNPRMADWTILTVGALDSGALTKWGIGR
jgi:hypothetical protein